MIFQKGRKKRIENNYLIGVRGGYVYISLRYRASILYVFVATRVSSFSTRWVPVCVRVWLLCVSPMCCIIGDRNIALVLILRLGAIPKTELLFELRV